MTTPIEATPPPGISQVELINRIREDDLNISDNATRGHLKYVIEMYASVLSETQAYLGECTTAISETRALEKKLNSLGELCDRLENDNSRLMTIVENLASIFPAIRKR